MGADWQGRNLCGSHGKGRCMRSIQCRGVCSHLFKIITHYKRPMVAWYLFVCFLFVFVFYWKKNYLYSEMSIIYVESPMEQNKAIKINK